MSRHATGKRDKCSGQPRLHPRLDMWKSSGWSLAPTGSVRCRASNIIVKADEEFVGLVPPAAVQRFWNSFRGVFSEKIIEPFPPLQTPRARCRRRSVPPPRRCLRIMCSTPELCSFPVALQPISRSFSFAFLKEFVVILFLYKS